MPNILTCVYCGEAYPEGTPPHSEKILTDHIKVCKKHPMRQAEVIIQKLRNALEGLVGTSKKEDLEKMVLFIKSDSVPEIDKVTSVNAIRVLIEISGVDRLDLCKVIENDIPENEVRVNCGILDETCANCDEKDCPIVIARYP